MAVWRLTASKETRARACVCVCVYVCAQECVARMPYFSYIACLHLYESLGRDTEALAYVYTLHAFTHSMAAATVHTHTHTHTSTRKRLSVYSHTCRLVARGCGAETCTLR